MHQNAILARNIEIKARAHPMDNATIHGFSLAAYYKMQDEGLAALSEVERIAFLVWMTEGSAGNGGMHAICYNDMGNYLAHIPGAFRAVGADRKASLHERLSAVFGPDGPSTDWQVRIQQHEALSYSATAQIDAIQDEYFSSGEDIEALLGAYLERHLT